MSDPEIALTVDMLKHYFLMHKMFGWTIEQWKAELVKRKIPVPPV